MRGAFCLLAATTLFLGGCHMADLLNRDGSLATSPLAGVYSPENHDGTYRNPIIFADYSDPDLCRVGSDFYMTASSFSSFPGLPILHSKDLVNWTIVGHALRRYPAPLDRNFDAPNHGNGVWAPAIRFHNGEFYIYFGDPDLGVFMTKTRDPRGVWEPLVRVKEAKGWIDTCPFWDDDGNAYLVHAFARSRAGINNTLDICRMSPDGTRLLDDGTRVYAGAGTPATQPGESRPASAGNYTTVEGPKLYKRDGFYYIMAPGGGVGPGYQIVFRSKHIFGPYDSRIVLDSGTTKINGPHQGGWVNTANGKEDWFIHFQEVLPYGRILHLEPVRWVDDWPVMGDARAGATKGQPVPAHKKPDFFGEFVPAVPQSSDEFDRPSLGLQWQWWANFKEEWVNLAARRGYLRMMAVAADKAGTLYNRPNLLLQKFPAEVFTVTAKVDVASLAGGETAGLVLAAKTMASLSCEKTTEGVRISRTNQNAADARSTADVVESSVTLVPREGGVVYLRMKVAAKGVCTFQVSGDGVAFAGLGTPVTAVNAQWIGAKVGLFCNAGAGGPSRGHMDVDWFHVEP